MPPTKIVIIEDREINQAQAASPPPLRTTYVNARFRIHKTSQTVSAATLSPLRIYIIAFSNLFYFQIYFTTKSHGFLPFTSPSSAFSPLIRTLFVRCARATKKRLTRSRAADQAFAEQTIRGDLAPPRRRDASRAAAPTRSVRKIFKKQK